MKDTMQALEELGRVDPAEREVLNRAAASLLALATTEADQRDTHLSGRTRPWVARAAAVALVLGAASGAGVALQGGSSAGPRPAATTVLMRLANVAAAQPRSSAPRPGQYLYVDSEQASTETVSTGAGSYTVLVSEQRQIWVAANGSGQIRESRGKPSFLSPTDLANWKAAGSPPIPSSPTSINLAAGSSQVDEAKLASLPTNPSILAADIASGKVETGLPGPYGAFTQVEDLLSETDPSPALRSAIYRVALGIPGVEALGTVTDHSGRSGVGIAYTHDGVQQELIFDPKTSALLGEQDTITGPGSGFGYDGVPGTVINWVVYLHSSTVNSIPAAAPTPAPTSPPATATASHRPGVSPAELTHP